MISQQILFEIKLNFKNQKYTNAFILSFKIISMVSSLLNYLLKLGLTKEFLFFVMLLPV